MKIPSKINIMGNEFRIQKIKDSYDGSFDMDARLITIGMAHKQEQDTIGILIHEISEVIHSIVGNRLYNGYNDSYMFVMDHARFQLHTEMLANIVYKLVKEENLI